MNAQQPSLLDILNPRCFPTHPKRAQVTRTITQPEIDLLEQAEAAAAKAVRRSAKASAKPSSRASCY